MGFCPGASGMLWRDGDLWEVHARGAAQSWAQVGVIAGKTPWRGCMIVIAVSHQRSLFSRVRTEADLRSSQCDACVTCPVSRVRASRPRQVILYR